jgi:hypothetical protein
MGWDEGDGVDVLGEPGVGVTHNLGDDLRQGRVPQPNEGSLAGVMDQRGGLHHGELAHLAVDPGPGRLHRRGVPHAAAVSA